MFIGIVIVSNNYDQSIALSNRKILIFLYSSRRLACVNAVKNARSKADAIAQFVNQRLGSAIEIKEENITEVTGESGHHEGANEFSIRARIAASTVTINVRISATFELEPKQKKKHR